MSNTGVNKRAVTVGVFIFLGLAFFIAGVLIVGNLRKTFTKSVTIRTVFDDVEGLKIGNNVWFSGVKIGTVRKMRFVNKSQVEVSMNIDEIAQEYIRKDSKAKIGSEGVIGNKLIVLYGGSQSSPPVDDGDMVVSETTYSMESMMTTLQKTNDNLYDISNDFKIVSKQIAGGEGTMGKLLYTDSLYRTIDAAVVSLQRAAANAQAMTASLSNFSSKLNQPGSFANDLVTDTVVFAQARAAVRELNETAASANKMTANIEQASNDPTKPLGLMLHDQETAKDLKETISNLETSTAKLNETLDAARYSFLLRGGFKRKAKADAKINEH